MFGKEGLKDVKTSNWGRRDVTSGGRGDVTNRTEPFYSLNR